MERWRGVFLAVCCGEHMVPHAQHRTKGYCTVWLIRFLKINYDYRYFRQKLLCNAQNNLPSPYQPPPSLPSPIADSPYLPPPDPPSPYLPPRPACAVAVPIAAQPAVAVSAAVQPSVAKTCRRPAPHRAPNPLPPSRLRRTCRRPAPTQPSSPQSPNLLPSSPGRRNLPPSSPTCPIACTPLNTCLYRRHTPALIS